MSKENINVEPTKELFIYMLTRDVSLENAIIDLIDNSVDGALSNCQSDNLSNFEIHITINKDCFLIEDNCGGIPINVAREYAFKFGRPKDVIKPVGNVGQFGIGMKRTIFKLGNNVSIESKSIDSEFKLDLDIIKWTEEPQNWSFDLDVISENTTFPLNETFTKVKIYNLHESISESFSQENFIGKLKTEIEEAHAYNLAKGLKILINTDNLEYHIPTLKSNNEIKMLSRTIYYNKNTDKEIKVRIYAGLNNRELNESGWYIYCNNRLLVSANKNMLTGWGANGERKFHHDYAFFKGYVFFESRNGDILPWNTTKDGINFNSDVYQNILLIMQTEMKPILSLLKDLGIETTRYNKDPDNVERIINDSIEELLDDKNKINLTMSIGEQRLIIPNYKLPSIRKMGTITYSKPIEELQEIMEHLGVNTYCDVGLITYDYYKENEME